MIETPQCSYTLLDDQIHRFVFEKSTRQAVDEHVAKLAELYRMNTANDTLRILIDLRKSGLPPMSYTFNALRKLNDQHPNAPRCCYAFLFSSSMMASMASAFFNLINPSKGAARFFLEGKEHEAVPWLLAR